MKEEKYTCIIIDDEFGSRQLLEYKIDKFIPQLTILGKYSDIQSALSFLSKHKHPDIIFLDLELPELNGFALLEYSLELTSKIIIVSAYEKYALQSIKFHVSDFLLKPVNEDELTESVKFVTGQIQKSPLLTGLSLSPRETKVLELVCKGMLNKEIAELLMISQSTVKNHLQNIYQKMNVQNRSEAILVYLKHTA